MSSARLKPQPRTTASKKPAAVVALPSAATLADQAYEQIKHLIFDFELMPGDRISETELAERVQVSRTPLRQALQRLQREGFMQVFPKSGWQVAPLDFDQFDELYDLRVLLECHAALRLCEAEERPALKEIGGIWLVPAAERQADADTVRDLDERFHAALVASSGNREMSRVHQDITERIRIIRRLDFTKPNRVEATYQEHAKILRAITQRRADEAQRLLRAHIEQSKLEVRHITLDMLYRLRRR
nr:GntR family transcriptional regulator [uncultured Caldimonas sp.]